jgi:hypothetical protein
MLMLTPIYITILYLCDKLGFILFNLIIYFISQLSNYSYLLFYLQPLS